MAQNQSNGFHQQWGAPILRPSSYNNQRELMLRPLLLTWLNTTSIAPLDFPQLQIQPSDLSFTEVVSSLNTTLLPCSLFSTQQKDILFLGYLLGNKLKQSCISRERLLAGREFLCPLMTVRNNTERFCMESQILYCCRNIIKTCQILAC